MKFQLCKNSGIRASDGERLCCVLFVDDGGGEVFSVLILAAVDSSLARPKETHKKHRFDLAFRIRD